MNEQANACVPHELISLYCNTIIFTCFTVHAWSLKLQLPCVKVIQETIHVTILVRWVHNNYDATWIQCLNRAILASRAASCCNWLEPACTELCALRRIVNSPLMLKLVCTENKDTQETVTTLNVVASVHCIKDIQETVYMYIANRTLNAEAGIHRVIEENVYVSIKAIKIFISKIFLPGYARQMHHWQTQ